MPTQSKRRSFEEMLEKINLKDFSKKRKKETLSLSVDYCLGYYVGESIVHRDLPTLDCSPITTLKVIKVSKYHKEKLKKIYKKATDENNYSLYTEYFRFLDRKYLPHKLSIILPVVNFNKLDDFKKGLINCLWNCDCCAYSLSSKDVIVKMDKALGNYFVTLKLPKNTNGKSKTT